MLLAIITHPLDRRLRSWLDGWVPVSPPGYQLDAMLIEARLRQGHQPPAKEKQEKLGKKDAAKKEEVPPAAAPPGPDPRKG